MKRLREVTTPEELHAEIARFDRVVKQQDATPDAPPKKPQFETMEEEEAYLEAELRVKKTHETGASGLSFSDLIHLSKLPLLYWPSELQWLDLSNTQVSDLSPIAKLTELKWLDLSNTQVADLSPIVGLSALLWLYLSNTQVSILNPLSGLSGLQRLDLDNTRVADLSSITGLSGLQRLSLENTPVWDLSPIASLSGLQRLYLKNTKVWNLSTIQHLLATGLNVQH